MRKKIILKNFQSPGDLVMLTAAVRDIHACCPRKYRTDVRTSCDELWFNNPYIERIGDDDPEVQWIDCSYPLIHFSNQRPYHFIHGFMQQLSDSIGEKVEPQQFHGDIHLSREERRWPTSLLEGTRIEEGGSYWILVAGGKLDFTIKWWDPERYQAVVDYFQDHIDFVQVGLAGHEHLKLDNVADLRGKTSVRQLIQLIHHSSGVVCPVTFAMHLAAAVPTAAHAGARLRPCVVIAGGREPPHWEAYPGHQYLHTVGSLPCCRMGGCWRSRTVPIGDGDVKDREDLCENVVGALPKCMDLIDQEDVQRAIKKYLIEQISS